MAPPELDNASLAWSDDGVTAIAIVVVDDVIGVVPYRVSDDKRCCWERCGVN